MYHDSVKPTSVVNELGSVRKEKQKATLEGRPLCKAASITALAFCICSMFRPLHWGGTHMECCLCVCGWFKSRAGQYYCRKTGLRNYAQKLTFNATESLSKANSNARHLGDHLGLFYLCMRGKEVSCSGKTVWLFHTFSPTTPNGGSRFANSRRWSGVSAASQSGLPLFL